ncbi:Subtilase family protein [Ceratocystis lukuohia]|uniref:Subtilase family protein n=1 Tax=Ceratocystis lukuohia TaxID=2019550 RepID=A0ABR4MQ60_9PEZI
MRFEKKTLLGVFTVSQIVIHGSRAQRGDAAINPSLKGYIVEYAHGNPGAKDTLASEYDIDIVHQFDSLAFSGASIRTSSHTIDTLSALDGIVNVWQNTFFQTRSVTKESPASESRVSLADRPNDMEIWHAATRVQELHDRGITGKGAKIAVIDTGIDYNHEALGGGFGPGFKVAGGYDLVGDDDVAAAGPAPVPDPDPMDESSHGTHVAGIIAGNTSWFKGVAPDATLYAYKVISDLTNFWSDDLLIRAFLMAYEDGVDIITASVGAYDGTPNNPWSLVASRLVDNGVIVTIASGNSGASGPFYASTGASGKNVLAVASTQIDNFPANPYHLNINGETSVDGYVTVEGHPPFPTSIVDWPIVAMSSEDNPTADACKPYPNGTASLKNKIPLVRRGGCAFASKQKHLTDIGAEYIFIYNYDETAVQPITAYAAGEISILVSSSGEAIIRAIRAGLNVTASFNTSSKIPAFLPSSRSSLPSSGTSWGSLNDLQVKPDIAAPGDFIFSTSLNNTWEVRSGTSMACPYVAGVAALYISVHGGRDVQGKAFAKRLSQRIISGGQSLLWWDGSSEQKAPVTQVGTGLIDAVKVLDYTSELSFEKIALNDSINFNGYHEFTVWNKGKEPVTYSFSTEAAAGIEALTDVENDVRIKLLYELTPVSLEPKITLPDKLTLQPGANKTVAVKFENPDALGWNTHALPSYSGKVLVHSSLGETLAIPYHGIAADLHNGITRMFRKGYPIIVSTLDSIPIAEKTTFTFDLSLEAQDFPRLRTMMVYGSDEARWDIFEPGYKESQWKYPPVVGQGGYVGSASYWKEANTNVSIPLYDPESQKQIQLNFPISVGRNGEGTADPQDMYSQFWWLGRLANGSDIASGTYSMRFAVLRPFGNRSTAIF